MADQSGSNDDWAHDPDAEITKMKDARPFPSTTVESEYKWLTVVSPEGPTDLELALEPNANPAGKSFQEAMFALGIPLAAFEVSDIQQEYARLKAHGVAFTREPTTMGPVTIAIFSDTCGNLIQLYQPN
jgi:hypothetical protein